MKKFILPLFVSLGLLFNVGCATKVGQTTEQQQLAKQERLERTALLIRNVTYSALVIVVEKSPNEKQKIRDYTTLGIAAVRTILNDNRVTPQDLQKALEAIPVNEFKSVEAKLIVPTVVSTYSIWLGEHTGVWYNSDKMATAKLFLNAILDGAQGALKVL